MAPKDGCWQQLRNSSYLVMVLVFFNLVSDSLLLTLVDPILPDILRNIDNAQAGMGILNSSSSSVELVTMITLSSSIVKTSATKSDISQENSTLLPQADELFSADVIIQTTTPSISFAGDIPNPEDPNLSHLINNNGRYGILMAAKGAMQFVCNPFVGYLVTRFGYRRPMLIGSVCLMASTVAFAFGNSYVFLFVVRLMQGAASSVTAVTGLGLLATTFKDETQRGKVIGIAIGGISLGIIAGPLYGSILYQFFGQAMPFLVLAAMEMFAIGLQLIGYHSDSGVKDHTASAIVKLAADPYILIVAGNIFILNLVVSIILAFLPMRLIDLEDPETWKLGIVVLPSSIGYLFAGLICPRTTKCIPRWLQGFVGQIFSSITVIGMAFSNTFETMLIVTTFTGIAVGMVSTAMQPIFATLVDLRHSSLYGNVYAISDMSVCLAFFIGPLYGGPVMYAIGFQWMVIGISVINFLFSFLCLFLRNPPAKEVNQVCPKTEKSPLMDSDAEIRGRSPSVNSLKSRAQAQAASGYAVPRYLDHLSDLEENYLSDRPGTWSRRRDMDDSYLSDRPIKRKSKKRYRDGRQPDVFYDFQ